MTDDRTEMQRAREAGLRQRHEQRLARRPVLTPTELMQQPTAPDQPMITGGLDADIPAVEVPEEPLMSEELEMDSLRINVARALRRYPIPTVSFSRAVDDVLAEVRGSLWLAQALQDRQVSTLREAAEGWDDGHEGFPYLWLLDRACEAEEGRVPNWKAEAPR